MKKYAIFGSSGAKQSKNSASMIDLFSLFSANPSLLGSFDSLAPALSPFGLHSALCLASLGCG
jgi:hypothetical protein